MSYAVRKDGRGFRAVARAGDCTSDETYSASVPSLDSVMAEVVVVSMRQARLALLAAGKLDAANAAIDALPGSQRAAAQIEWEFASEVRKDSPLIAMLAPVIGLDAQGLATLFTAAAAL